MEVCEPKLSDGDVSLTNFLSISIITSSNSLGMEFKRNIFTLKSDGYVRSLARPSVSAPVGSFQLNDEQMQSRLRHNHAYGLDLTAPL